MLSLSDSVLFLSGAGEVFFVGGLGEERRGGDDFAAVLLLLFAVIGGELGGESREGERGGSGGRGEGEGGSGGRVEGAGEMAFGLVGFL